MHVVAMNDCMAILVSLSKLTLPLPSPPPRAHTPFIDRFVMDTHNRNLWQLTDILYFDPYMRLHSDTLQKICDEGKQDEDLTEDLLLDFSYDYLDCADMFQEMLLEGNNRG